METTSGTSASGPSEIYVPQQVVYDGGGTTSNPLTDWDGTRNGIAEYVSLDGNDPLSTFARLSKFLAMSNIQILDADDISHTEFKDSEIKRGASTQVLAGDYNGKPVALKYMRLARLSSEQQYRDAMYDLLFELKVMTHEPLCRHRNIVRAFGITFDPNVATTNDMLLSDIVSPVVVVEPADPAHPDLSDLFKVATQATFTFEVLAGLIADVADGIAILHEYGLTHSDIKPENILIFSDEEGRMTAKIGDFGASGLEATKDKPRGVTWYWAAPESLDSCPLPELREMRFGRAHDAYAFGLVAGFIMLLGKRPIPDPDPSGRSVSDTKYNDVADDVVYSAIKDMWEHRRDHSASAAPQVLSRLEIIHTMLEQTLRLFPNARMGSLDGIREHLTGSDDFASERLKHKFMKRNFVERDSSLLGNVLGRNTGDAFDISPNYSVYSNLPEFLYPLLQKAGLDESPSTKYYPRSLLGDQPIISLRQNDENDFQVTRELEAEHREASKAWWEQLDTLRSGAGTEEQANPADPQRYAEECETFRQVTGFSRTIQELANLLKKMLIWPNLYGGTNTYPEALLRLSETSDPRLFTIKDPRYGYKTFLHAACAIRDLQTAQFILNHGADVNATDGQGITPMMQTFLEPFVFFRSAPGPVIKEAPGDPVIKEAKDIPAEMTIRVARFLISQGATLEFEHEGAPLMAILETLHFNANKPKLIDFLIQQGYPVNSFHPRLGTALFCAAINGNVDSVRRLLRLRADPNAKCPNLRDDISDTALQRAMSDHHSLLEAVAEDCLGNKSDTARLEIFELLLQHGATVYPRKGQVGSTDSAPMAHAFILFQRCDMLKILLKYHPGFVFSMNAAGHTPLHLAAWARDLEAVQLLIDHGADLNARSMDGVTPFNCAFSYNKGLWDEVSANVVVEPPEVLEKSIEIGHVLGAYGADITARRNWQFSTPNRMYLESDDPMDINRSLPLAFTDDAFVMNWKMWALRRNLDNDIAACGGALFMKPSIAKDPITSMEIWFPVVKHNGYPPSPGLYYFSVRLGVLDCQTNDMMLSFMMLSESKDGSKDGNSGSFPIGAVTTKRLPRNHACEIKFEAPVFIEPSSTRSVIFLFVSAWPPAAGPALAGLFLDWIELSPIPPNSEQLVEGFSLSDGQEQQQSGSSEHNQWRYGLERVVDVKEKIPRGIWKMMAEEPVDRTEDNTTERGRWREFRPLRLKDFLNSSSKEPRSSSEVS
ncbi:ankyrin [Coniochaeta ligniaria NRRL 30616]|uniref:Ankyrin n=1 Tax=Coniochaeta ligniaria NRRL 30616 TaxID=1408157 RepID=A0A1J7J4R4_9PEZI|nr:ankyrin [Coniochaeta ligniaria NRRL 30616]